MRVNDIDFTDILLDKKSYKNRKILKFMTLHRKLLWVQVHCVLGSMQQID